MSNKPATDDAKAKRAAAEAADLKRAARLIDGIRERLRVEMSIDLAKLFDALGNRAVCSSCGAQIWWITTKTGSNMPVSGKGVAHWADCPNADIHRRR